MKRWTQEEDNILINHCKKGFLNGNVEEGKRMAYLELNNYYNESEKDLIDLRKIWKSNDDSKYGIDYSRTISAVKQRYNILKTTSKIIFNPKQGQNTPVNMKNNLTGVDYSNKEVELIEENTNKSSLKAIYVNEIGIVNIYDLDNTEHKKCIAQLSNEGKVFQIKTINI